MFARRRFRRLLVERDALALQEEADLAKVGSGLLVPVPALGQQVPHLLLANVRLGQLHLGRKGENFGWLPVMVLRSAW